MVWAKPDHFTNKKNFLFVLSDGKVIGSEVIANKLRDAAMASGIPAAALSVISLRAGGASAMWDAGFSVDEI